MHLQAVLKPYYDGVRDLARVSSPHSEAVALPDFKRQLGNLAVRAIDLFRAFAVTAVIIAAVDHAQTLTVLTIAAPNRVLRRRRFYPPWAWVWSLITATAQLNIALLLPSADAERKVQLNLPPGVIAASRRTDGGAVLRIETGRPLAASELSDMLAALNDPKVRREGTSAAIWQSIAELAETKADASLKALRDSNVRWSTRAVAGAETVEHWLNSVRQELSDLAHGRSAYGAVGAETKVATARSGLDDLAWERMTLVDSISPDVIVGRAHIVDDITERASPVTARLQVHVTAADVGDILIARFSGWMNAILMGLVLAFFTLPALGMTHSKVEIDVITFVLTLFSVVQAGRITRPDSSTLPGLLSRASVLPATAVILPTLTLAVALGFGQAHSWSVHWTIGCIAFQMLLQGLLIALRFVRERAVHDARLGLRAALRRAPAAGEVRVAWTTPTTRCCIAAGCVTSPPERSGSAVRPLAISPGRPVMTSN